MKKIVLLLLCLIVAFSATGCGKDSSKGENAEKTKIEDKADKKEDEKNDTQKEESMNEEKKDINEKDDSADASDGDVVNVPVGTEAPVIESTEELESIVDEFNTTEDPAKKEELRKKLEAFLAQAEAVSE